MLNITHRLYQFGSLPFYLTVRLFPNQPADDCQDHQDSGDDSPTMSSAPIIFCTTDTSTNSSTVPDTTSLTAESNLVKGGKRRSSGRVTDRELRTMGRDSIAGLIAGMLQKYSAHSSKKAEVPHNAPLISAHHLVLDKCTFPLVVRIAYCVLLVLFCVSSL
jgi:hypothetical protein